MKPTEQELQSMAENAGAVFGIEQVWFVKGFQEAISQMQPEWVALEQENEKLRKTIELAISGLEMYNNTGGLYVDIKLALRASIGMELITVNGDIDAKPQPPTK